MSRILIVDDDKHLTETLSDILREEGHSVIYARSGDRAYRSMERSDPPVEVVICDWDLGVYDTRHGGEIVTLLRNEWSSPRYIIWSGLDRVVPEGVEFFDKGHLLELIEALA